MTLNIDSLADFTLDNFRRVAWQAEPVTIGPQARACIEEMRAAFMALVDSDPIEPIYGVTTGFGDTAKTRLDAEVLSHEPAAEHGHVFAVAGVGENRQAVAALAHAQDSGVITRFDGR